jgi:hypothetical protein
MPNSKVSSGDIITPQKVNEITVGDTAPSTTGLSVGSLWVDTSVSGKPKIKYWTGSAWNTVTSTANLVSSYVGQLGPVTAYQSTQGGSTVATLYFPSSYSQSQYRTYVVGQIRQTVTMTSQTYWQMRVQLNGNITINEFQVNNTNPGTYFFAVEHGPVPSSGFSSYRIAAPFTGYFIPDSATPGTVYTAQTGFTAVQWSSASLSYLSVYLYDTAPNLQGVYEIGPIHVYRLDYSAT